MTAQTETKTLRPRRSTRRTGSALVLVLIMTLSLAGLAISAIYLSSSAGLLTRYYDKERDYRYAAEAALALGKSRVNADSFMTKLPTPLIPDATAWEMVTAGSLADAAGTAIPNIKVNLYVGFTGDTVGRFGNFITLLSQAYDVGGTRHVRRLDLASESFSRFAMFVNTFSSGLAYGDGEFIRGRAHSNQGWYSGGSTGPTYFDTVSAVTTINGLAVYKRPSLPGSPVIPFPTIAKLAALTGYALAANLQFTPVTASGTAQTHTCNGSGVSVGPCPPSGGSNRPSIDLSGRTTAPNAASLASPVRGTRVSFRPVDMDGDGTYNQEDEGMMMIFDTNLGIDTSAIRVDLPHDAPVAWTHSTPGFITLLNQCGLMAKIPTIGAVPAHNEFFPIARFGESWVLQRLRMAGVTTAVGALAFSNADTTAWRVLGPDSLPANSAIDNILSKNVSNSRCFPVGSPFLMLTERYVDTNCAVTTDTTQSPWGWGSTIGMGTACAASKQYGGQDTTFTATVTRCVIYGRGGRCKGGRQIPLGAWRTWAGAALPAIPANVLQAVQKPYLWPLFKPFNLPSKGVINATTGPVYLGSPSDTLRGNVTFYQSNANKDIVFIDDLVYDQDPTTPAALCRNFLGIIAGRNVVIADNALNRPRQNGTGSANYFYGIPDFTLHAVTMSLTGTVGVEDGYNYPTWSPAGPVATTVRNCPQGNPLNPTSGGCINQTGGVIEQVISPTYTSSGNTGMRENRSVDPCQSTNRKPPFFPSTGRYLDNKYYEIDPVNVASDAQVQAFFTRLRGRSAP